MSDSLFFIEDQLALEDMKRAEGCQAHHMTLAAAHHALIEAWRVFAVEAVAPICKDWKDSTPREYAFIGLFYRTLGFAQTVVILNHPIHFQSLVSAERSIIEIYLDTELLSCNVLANGVERFSLFIELQKLKSARRADDFFTQKPHLDTDGKSAEAQRGFIARSAARLEVERARVFLDGRGRPVTPEHWTQKNLPERAALLDEVAEKLVVEGYDARNFAVHTGLAGVVGVNQQGIEMMCTLSLNNITDCLRNMLKILGKELGLERKIPKFQRVVALFEDLPSMAFIDKCLQLKGEPSRLILHPGTDWTVA